jgi:glycogen debranching enzyme
MALEGDDSVVPGAGSQLGWLLWADALSAEAAARVAERLVRPDLLTAYGVRTLASTAPAFLAEGYHRGAVWPHDCWLCWGGLRRAGYDEAAEQVREGVRRAVATVGDHPELYAVTPDGTLRDLPIANRVQAWTVGAMIAFDAGWDGRVSR